MDLKSVINIILGDLKEAADLMDELKNKPDYPELRAELAKSKCRSAGDMIRLIGDILEEPGTEESDGAKENIAAEREAKEAGETKEAEESKEAGETKETEEAEEKTEAGKPGDKKDIDKNSDEKKEIQATEVEEKVKEKKADKIIADRFAHLSSRMNEKVGDSKKTGGKIRTIPVTDLNRALGVNDRFYFIRELFNGNAELFRETIDKLNRASTITEAHEILSRELADMADTEAALQLFELVERKLSVK